MRLTELVETEKGAVASSETELARQVKRIEADKLVLKDVLEAQILTLQVMPQITASLHDRGKSIASRINWKQPKQPQLPRLRMLPQSIRRCQRFFRGN